MTLRARLVITMAALLALALIVSGAAVVGLTRASLLADLDHDLLTARPSDVSTGGPQQPDATGRRFALLLYDGDGEQVQALPSGFSSSPDALPDVALDGAGALPMGDVVERPATDGSLTYRVLAVNARIGAPPQPVTLVLAAPMRALEGTIGGLVRTLALVGLVVLGLLIVIGWLLIRRDMRPLERVTATAEQISTGDLSQRAGMPDDGSEVGKLSHAFDRMLDQIEASFASQQQALRAKEASEQMLRQFVADASHELRTPLTTVRGYADLHRAGGLEKPADVAQAMDRIGSESRRMGALVDDLLLLARLDQGRPLRADQVALSGLVDDAVRDIRAVEPGRPVNADLAPDLTVTGDEDRLRQLVGNLLANVRVHTPADSPVEVSLTQVQESAVLKVTDHGPGIDPEHAEHVFDRFYRADTSRTRDRGGSGLGLAIAASIAAAHGGSLEHSATPGSGATFTLTLPRG
ncbi:MAG: HAMP domain-containing sensor histidine kinase [Chloroflexota bacterium]